MQQLEPIYSVNKPQAPTNKMTINIVHIIDYAKHAGGLEQYLYLRACKSINYHHSLIAIHAMEPDFIAPFKHAICLQGRLINHQLSSRLTQLDPQLIIIYNNLTRLPELIEYKKASKIPVIFSAHDYAIFSTAHGYNRLTLKKETSDYQKTGFYIPFKKNIDSNKIVKTTRKDVLSRIEHLNQIDAIEVPSASMQRTLKARFKLTDIHVSKPHSFAFSSTHSNPESKNILFIGSCIKGKGIKFMKSALAKINIPFTLTVIGSGNFERYLKRQELPDCQKLTIYQQMKQTDLSKCYQNSACVISTSIIESFGMTMLEATSHSRSVASFNIDGVSDQIEHGFNGLLATPFNTIELAENISSLLKDYNLRRKLESNAYALATEQYSVEAISAEFYQLLKVSGVH